MKSLFKLVLAFAFGAIALYAADAPKKNWTPPAYKIYAQVLSDQIMAEHPELISVTFHGVPPGLKDVYTMFAGSFPERIGNPDDDDDAMVCRLGITIIDSRWNRLKDPAKKFVMMLPLRDAAGNHLGLLVAAYKNPDFSPTVTSSKQEADFFAKGMKLRDDLQKKIPSYAALFEKAK